MSKRLLDWNPQTKTAVYHHYDPNTDVTHIEHIQDVQPFIERAKKLANDTSYKRAGIKNDWYHFAHVPNVVLMELKAKFHLDWSKKEDLPKIEKILQQEYKRLLTVDKI